MFRETFVTEANKRSIETQTLPPEEATDHNSTVTNDVENDIRHTHKRKSRKISRAYTDDIDVDKIEDIRERVNSMVLDTMNDDRDGNCDAGIISLASAKVDPDMRKTRQLVNRIRRKRKAEVSWNVIRTQLVSARVRREGVVIVRGLKYTLLERLGGGGYAKVYSAYDDQKHVVALKVTNLREEDGSINMLLIQEAELMLRLSTEKSKYIIRMLNHEMRSEAGLDMLYMVMELGQGSLQELITREEDILSFAAIRLINGL